MHVLRKRPRTGIEHLDWTKEDFYRLGELGFLQGKRVELIEGQLMVLSPQKTPHATTLALLTRLLPPLFGTAFHVRVQLPLDLGRRSEPEPDFAVVTGDPNDYAAQHPTTAALLIEVSDSTVGYDRRRKGSLYARAGIADYWLINLRHKQLEVYRVPIPDAAARYGFRYANRSDALPGNIVSPLALPQAAIAVADLFPA